MSPAERARRRVVASMDPLRFIFCHCAIVLISISSGRRNPLAATASSRHPATSLATSKITSAVSSTALLLALTKEKVCVYVFLSN